jgi:hypothetical protein
VIVIIIWLGVMGLAAAGASWLFLSRFPLVFFNTQRWTDSAAGRRTRVLLIVLLAAFGLVVLGGAVALGIELLAAR